MHSVGKKQVPRIIPCLLIKGHGLTKTIQFGDGAYIGDAINAVKIYNEKEVDEIMLLDIEASKKSTEPRVEFIREIATEAFMPLSYGGGITTLKQMEDLFKAGVEKVCLNSVVYSNPDLVNQASKIYGSQSVVVSVDVKRTPLLGYKLFSAGGTTVQKVKLIDHVKKMQDLGAGEIVINSIDRDGMMKGFDTDLITQVANAIDVPLVALGGAGSHDDLVKAINAGSSAVAAGSIFVFHGKHKAVLITYPSRARLKELFLK